MILFHSDLDNTLVYSYKYDIGLEKKCVEIYQGKELSFMHPEWIKAIKRIQKKSLFVPTTTRTVEQYKRIEMGIPTPEYALVCTGGILLKDGHMDMDWYEESLRLISDAKDELEIAIQVLKEDTDRSFEVRWIEQLFVFTKSKNPTKSILNLKRYIKEKRVNLYQNGTKIYVIPKKLEKGMGVIRLKRMLKAEKILAAGDSELDKSMLLAADIGICPEGLWKETYPSIHSFSKESFTKEMLQKIEYECNIKQSVDFIK